MATLERGHNMKSKPKDWMRGGSTDARASDMLVFEQPSEALDGFLGIQGYWPKT